MKLLRLIPLVFFLGLLPGCAALKTSGDPQGLMAAKSTQGVGQAEKVYNTNIPWWVILLIAFSVPSLPTCIQYLFSFKRFFKLW